MKTFVQGPLADTARNLLRRAGYGEHRGRESQLSYVKRLQGTAFPRFHAYVEDRDGGMQLNLHLDQKEATHAGGHAHGGEYDGTLVERETERIVSFIRSLSAGERTPSPESSSDAGKPKARGLFGWLWGD